MGKIITLDEIAQENMRTHFVDNPHRGLVVGMNDTGVLMQFVWIMGRSEPSKNRIYVEENNIIRTDQFKVDPAADTRLIIYNAMQQLREGDNCEEDKQLHIVGNGNQTDTVMDAWKSPSFAYISAGLSNIGIFYSALTTRYCESDPPIVGAFTARITAYQDTTMPLNVFLSVLKADPFAKEHWINTLNSSGLKKEDFAKEGMTTGQVLDALNREVGRLAGLDHEKFPTLYDAFQRPIQQGFGYCITTYMPGSKDLPPFKGEPLLVPIRGTLEENMAAFWNVLDAGWKVAIAGKEIFADGHYRYAKENLHKKEE